ncbi:hypothetical protein D9615_009077 [Tricholomella constricta]|uniref:Uncharacterized protein n=1 Tax=Tricholomella constricta TaxID=117010 RepID=A0A8H5H181_9AGAR|nr:hypothetical protein D9615_009077 [Tricholomella constricta]
MRVDILILGAGWTSTFLMPLCTERSLTYAATTRSGRDETIQFVFDPESEDIEPYKVLPDAQTVVITFPIELPGASARFVRLYRSSREEGEFETGFIQLGTTGIWDGNRKKNANASATTTPKPAENKWYDRHTPFVPNARASAEIELLAQSTQLTPTTVLNLAGLWGGSRSPRNWVSRVAPTKEALRTKGSIHLIHGLDVSRAILAVHASWAQAAGQRWILTDGRVYDWWDLASAWGLPAPFPAPAILLPSTEQGQTHLNMTTTTTTTTVTATTAGEDRGPHARWVRELMREEGVRALPRDVGMLGRALDSSEFWYGFGLSPLKARLE